MIYILTGEDITKSRIELSKLIENKNFARLDGRKNTVADLEMQISSTGLFNDSQAVVVENFTKAKPAERFIELALNSECDVILWDEADLPAKFKTAFKGARIYSFVFPKYYYDLLDGFVPGNKQLVNVLHNSLKSLEPEQVLYGLIKRVRQLIILKGDKYQEFSDFSRMQDWQLGRLRSQSAKWSEEGLRNAFISFSELDEKIKTSSLSLDLSSHLDILLTLDLN